MKKIYPILLMSLVISHAHATPASTEYVNSHIQDAVAGLEMRSTAAINALDEQTKERINTLAIELQNAITALQNQIQITASALETQIQQSNTSAEQQKTALEDEIDQVGHRNEHALGELYQGGMVFWLTPAKDHGLIIALQDSSEPTSWQNGEAGDKVTNARADGLYAGFGNTALIIAQQTADDQQGHFAALQATHYSASATGESPCEALCYSGWYLPSKTELQLAMGQLLQLNPQSLQGLYWSSTEASVNEAWAVSSDGHFLQLDKNSSEPHVRPIRSF